MRRDLQNNCVEASGISVDNFRADCSWFGLLLLLLLWWVSHLGVAGEPQTEPSSVHSWFTNPERSLINNPFQSATRSELIAAIRATS
ncbi:hypothetical protein AWZ03_000662 [Drosophila navojoa]|uniref:Uncharacterized protein n=1 Tax=Drosophila navojoa TaxID=7232 RepID=A0A484BWB6_DRONA|nr:hypothetical protein AWZ03_000662 [Drosophila navojoa]